MCPKPNSLEVILNAAESVVIERGAGHMTLDAVAAEACVSKGGLLYHFPNKEALLKAMLERHARRLDEGWKEKCAELQNGPTRPIKAYVLSSLARDRKAMRISVALLAAAAHNPRLLEPVRNRYQKVLAELAPAGLRFERAAVIALAAEGLRLIEILLLSPLKPGQRKRVIEELFRLADEATR
jgi:AcrR family transcriptional regulator